MKQALEKVITLRTELNEVNRRKLRLEKQREEVLAEQERIRKNLQTLDRSGDAYQRQQKLFDEVETRIAQVTAQLNAAREEEEQKQRALDEYLLSLNVE